MHEKRKDRRLMMVVRKMTEVRTPGEGAEDTSNNPDQEAMENFWEYKNSSYEVNTKVQLDGAESVDQLRRVDGSDENLDNESNLKGQSKTNTRKIIENEACKSDVLDHHHEENRNDKEESESSLDELYFQSSESMHLAYSLVLYV